jgi:hypothetical protein
MLKNIIWYLSRQSGYHWTFIIEGDTVEKVVQCWGYVGSWSEVGTSIRITWRIIARSVISSHMIAFFNIKVDLKSKDKWDCNKVYRWCCYGDYQIFTKKCESILVDLKYGDRDISESSLV